MGRVGSSSPVSVSLSDLSSKIIEQLCRMINLVAFAQPVYIACTGSLKEATVSRDTLRRRNETRGGGGGEGRGSFISEEGEATR